MDAKLIPIAQQEGFQIQLHPKKKQNFEWERCDGELIFTKAPSHLGQQAIQNFNTSL
jgi:hypothetical protein